MRKRGDVLYFETGGSTLFLNVENFPIFAQKFLTQMVKNDNIKNT